MGKVDFCYPCIGKGGREGGSELGGFGVSGSEKGILKARSVLTLCMDLIFKPTVEFPCDLFLSLASLHADFYDSFFSFQNQYNLARAQQSYKSLVQIHEKNGTYILATLFLSAQHPGNWCLATEKLQWQSVLFWLGKDCKCFFFSSSCTRKTAVLK